MLYRMGIVRYGRLGTLEIHLLPWREIMVKTVCSKTNQLVRSHTVWREQSTTPTHKKHGQQRELASKIHFAFLRCLGTWALIAVNIQQDTQRCDCEHVQAVFCGELRYKTHPTDPWHGQRMFALILQFERLQTECPEFSLLCTKPFRLHSRQPIHTTHGSSCPSSSRLGWGRSAA